MAITHGASTLCLAFELAEPYAMKVPPRDVKKGLVSKTQAHVDASVGSEACRVDARSAQFGSREVLPPSKTAKCPLQVTADLKSPRAVQRFNRARGEISAPRPESEELCHVMPRYAALNPTVRCCCEWCPL